MCLLCVLVCRSGRTHSTWRCTQVFPLYGWKELVPKPGKMAGGWKYAKSRCDHLFDWEHDGTCDHVGIVERCDGTTVYTVEGNSGDAVRERSYAIRSDSIMGYGMVVY